MTIRNGITRKNPVILGGAPNSPPEIDGDLNQIAFKSIKMGSLQLNLGLFNIDN